MKGFDLVIIFQLNNIFSTKISLLQHYLNLLSTADNCLGSLNMLSNFVVAVFTASGHSLPCLAVANDACTTLRYSTKFSSGCTGPLVAIAALIK